MSLITMYLNIDSTSRPKVILISSGGSSCQADIHVPFLEFVIIQHDICEENSGSFRSYLCTLLLSCPPPSSPLGTVLAHPSSTGSLHADALFPESTAMPGQAVARTAVISATGGDSRHTTYGFYSRTLNDPVSQCRPELKQCCQRS